MSDTQRRPGPKPPPDPAATVEALHQKLKEAIDAIESGEQWQAWLDFAGKLHRYSFNNLILILTQRPTASHIAGYNAWKSLGRQVRRGEKAIRVLAPVTRRGPVIDADGKPQKGPDGKVQTRQQIVGFRPAPVFDISQTDGPPAPQQGEPELLTGAAPDGLWDALAGEIAEHGYRLLRCPASELDGANGLTKVPEREVWVRDDVDPAQAVKTLAHELAHVMLHTADGTIPQCRDVVEVEAESVAHLVLGVHHVDTGSYTFPYVANWAYPIAAVEHVAMADIVARTGARVTRAADEIITATRSVINAPTTDPLVPAAVRIAASTRQSAEFRDQSEVAALPKVDRDILFGVVADSHDFYRRQIHSRWVPNYLTQRKLGEAIESHQIGYAPASWTTLTDHLRSLGYTDDHIEAAGMATRARTGRLIDRMRDRLIIPLRDHHGDVVAFTGRIAPHRSDIAAPKYLNTSTTAIFQKREVLYGLAEHRRDGAEEQPVVICEGPLDAIAVDHFAADQHLNIFGVAASGTAFTRDHAAQLLAATTGQPICLAFDADPAGIKATETAWKELTAERWHDIKAAELPDGTDPAALYAADPALLAYAIRASRPAGEIVAERLIDAANLAGNIHREVAAFRDLVIHTRRMPPQDRVPYTLKLAERLRIDPPLAASLIAEIKPAVILERTIHHCQDLNQQLVAAQARQQTMITDPATTAQDQLLTIRTQ